MPWAKFKEGDKFCVYKMNADNEKDGESLGCHDTKEKAQAQIDALYAGEDKGAAKTLYQKKYGTVDAGFEQVARELYAGEDKGAAKVGAQHSAKDNALFKTARSHIKKADKALMAAGAPDPDPDEDDDAPPAKKTDGTKTWRATVKCLMGAPDPYQYAISEGYHVGNAANILSNIAYLLTSEIGEHDEDPKDVDQLVGVARGLIKFMLDELDELQQHATPPQATPITTATAPESVDGAAAMKVFGIERKLTGGPLKSLGRDGWKVKAQAVLFGDKDHADLSDWRDFFTPDTDFWADSWKTRPMIYNHGLIDMQAAKAMTLSAKTSEQKDAAREFKAVLDELQRDPRMGEWTKTAFDPLAFWVEGEIDKAKKYAEYLKQMVKLGYLKISSDSASHLVIREKQDNGTHKVLRWPIIAASPTPTPAEPRLAPIELATAAYKSFGVTVPEFDSQALAIGAAAQSADATRLARARLQLEKARLNLTRSHS